MKDKTLLFVILAIIAVGSGYYVLVHEGAKNSEKIKEVIQEEPENKPINISTEEPIVGTKDVVETTKESNLINKKPMTLEEKLQTTRPEMTIDVNKEYIVTLKTTVGDIVIKMDAKNKPITANNFVSLSKMGFYDGIKFHRVIDNFMIQGGDPLGNGTGGPAYKFEDELNTPNSNLAGTIAMANSGPNTNGSQFFINTVDNNYLDTKHTVFGTVIEGMDVVHKIEKAEQTLDPIGRPTSELETPILITNTIVEEK